MNPALAYALLSQVFVTEQTVSPAQGHDGDRFGSALADGDFDADGYDDLLVGATADDAAYVYRGGAAGLDLASEARRSDSDGGFGESASAGDIDGDGYDDAVVGARLGQGVGSATVLYGGASGLGARTETLLAPDPAGTSYGAAVTTGGDLDGDGYDDLVVGAYQTGGGVGALHVYYGGPTGLERARDQVVVASDAGPATLYGRQLAFAGDVNGDGYDDLVVGAEFDSTAASLAGAAYLYFGGPSGLDPATEVKVTGLDRDDFFGSAVAGAGDVDGDGYDDVLVGAHGDARLGVNAGVVRVLHGSPAGLDRGRDQELFASDAHAEALFGRQVAGLGDVDADGYADVAVGSFGANADEGAVYVIFGGPAGLDPSTEHRIAGGVALAAFGYRIAGLDANGDGYADLAAGGNYDQQAVVRPVSLFFGGCRDCSDPCVLDTATEDTGTPPTPSCGTTTTPPDGDPSGSDVVPELDGEEVSAPTGGCGCAYGGPSGVLGILGGLIALALRRAARCCLHGLDSGNAV